MYQSFSDYNHAGLGCSTVSDRLMVSSPREVILGILVAIIIPMFIVLAVSTQGFRTKSFRKHPLRNITIIGSLVIFLIELSPYPLIEIADFNTLDDAQLTQALEKVLTASYGKAKIPISIIDKQLFENEKWEKAHHKNFAISFGPRKAQATTLTSDILYFHTDQLGSTRLITRADGSVYQYMNYLPFGKILEGVITGDDLPYFAQFKNSYTGQEMDRNTGLYFYQSRFYDAEIGRFISADTVIPRALDGQTFNRYTYVNNNPFKFADPTGHNAVLSFIIAAVEAIAVAAVIAVGTVIGTLMGMPYLGIYAGMLLSGIFSAVGAAVQGASGGDIVGAFIMGAAMTGISCCVGAAAAEGDFIAKATGLIMTGASVAQAVASNNPDTIASCVGGLVGGIFVSSLENWNGGGTNDNQGEKVSTFTNQNIK